MKRDEMRMKKRLEAGSGLFFLAMRTPGEGKMARLVFSGFTCVFASVCGRTGG